MRKDYNLNVSKSLFLGAIVLLAPIRINATDISNSSTHLPAATSLQQAKYVVTGVVKDQSGPIIGANVVEKGTTNGTITDLDGNFSIEVSPQSVLVISYVGYLEQQVPVNNQKSITISLQEDSQALEEVVVVGYGIQKKVNLTGSIASVNIAEEMKSRTVTNLSNSLAGMMAGVTALQSTGAPGSDGASIRIRGLGTLNSSAPLILIDGIEGSMDAVNPQDVESISVLKDAASSAIYGARAANGVVLITTKKGKKGSINVNYSGHISFLTPANKYDFVTNYADYMELMNEANTGIGNGLLYSQETIDLWREKSKDPNGLTELGYPNYVAYPNTDWEDYLFSTGLLNEHSVSVNGGSEKARYLLSAGYQDNPGIVDRTGVKKYTLRSNVESNVTKWLTVGMNTYAVQQDYDMSNFDSANTYLYATTPGSYPKYDGVYGGSAADEENQQDNNLAYLLESNLGNKRVSRFNTTLFSKINFLENLTWEVNFNYARRVDDRRSWADGQRYKLNFRTGNIASTQTALSQMSVSTYNFNEHSYTLENLLRYNETIGDHDFGGLLGYQEYYYRGENLSTTKQGLLDYSLTVPDAAMEMKSITGTAIETATRSFFGRVNYAYKSRYLFEANLRYDASSRFHKDNRWGVFPSFSGAWRISEEGFMKDFTWLDNLKLRASWGKLGNNVLSSSSTFGINEYQYQSTYDATSYSLNSVQMDGLASTSIANALLQWESTAVTNIGIDMTFLKNRLDIVLEGYEKHTDGILYQPTIYLTAGNKSAPYMNIAEVTNRGAELTVSWRDKVSDFRYFISGNISYNKNEVSKYKGQLEQGWVKNDDGTETYKSNIGDVSTGSTTRVLEGKIINEYYLLNPYKGNGSYYNSDGSLNIAGGPKDGMIRTEEDMSWVKAMIAAGYTFMPNQSVSKSKIWYGDYIYADNNGDGIYGNSYDYKFQNKSSRPPVFYGFQMSASYKNFDMSANLTGTLFSKLYWSPAVGFSTATRWGYQISKDIAENRYFYDPENPSDSRTNINSKYGRLVGETGYQNLQPSTLYLFNANYLKMKNLTFGYTLPDNIAKKAFTESIRLYINAENLFTLTKYPGIDPELGAGHTYMTSRSFSFGANITF